MTTTNTTTTRATATNPTGLPALGLGIGWRPELALAIERRRDLGFIELLAENHLGPRGLPVAVHQLLERGVTAVPHGVALSLGSADLPDRERLAALARLCRDTRAPLVSEHVAFVRAGGRDSGHLLPVPRTREALDILVRNVRAAQAMLPVPLALENIASLFAWPDAEMRETDFWNELLERTGALMLLDVENLYAERRNHGLNAEGFLNRIPLERVAYVHVAGGVTGPDGLYHDTHAHPLPSPVLELLQQVCRRHRPPGILLERDDHFPTAAVLNDELDAVATFLEGAHAGPAFEPAEWHVAA